MVMVTRSAYRRATESFSSSDVSRKNDIPPWCSSGKVYERKPRKVASPRWEISSYPIRENIWEYLYQDNDHKLNCNVKKYGKVLKKNKKSSVMMLTVFCFTLIGMIVGLWMCNKIPKVDLITKVIPSTKLIALYLNPPTSVSEECCHQVKYLTAALLRAQQAIRNTLRVRRNRLLAARTHIDITKHYGQYIEGAAVIKGGNTQEWGGQVALWGILPLWRVAPSPDTVLALRNPTPSDCWPFSGSRGEFTIELVRKQAVHYISIEHIRPDSARSAPRHFVLYGLLENGTRIKDIDGEYKNNGPAKQYYPFKNNKMLLRRVVFQVLSNQGNPKYTCIYRVHLYGSYVNRKL